MKTKFEQNGDKIALIGVQNLGFGYPEICTSAKPSRPPIPTGMPVRPKYDIDVTFSDAHYGRAQFARWKHDQKWSPAQ